MVIDQVGYWPMPKYNADVRRAARRTRDAQDKFCSEDLRAALVQTDDLARFYHYDAASFLYWGIGLLMRIKRRWRVLWSVQI